MYSLKIKPTIRNQIIVEEGTIPKEIFLVKEGEYTVTKKRFQSLKDEFFER